MHNLDYRKTLKNCAGLVPFVSKRKHKHLSPHPVWNWNTNVQEVTCSPSAPQWKSLWLFWVSQAAELTLLIPAEPGSSIALNRKQFTCHKLRVQGVKKPNTNLSACAKDSKIQPNWCENCWKYANCIYCSCPQDSGMAKVILLVCSNRTDESIWSLWCVICPLTSTLWGREHYFQLTLPQDVPSLCWLKGAFTVGKDTAQVLQLPEEVQKLQHPKKSVPMSECKLKQHKDSSRVALSGCPLPCLDLAFPFSSLLVQVQHLKKVFNIWAEPVLPFPEPCLKNQPKGPYVCY